MSDQSGDREIVSETNSTGFVKWIVIALGVLIAIVIVALVVAILGGVTGSDGVASAFRILRDFFIIVLALQGILISFALVILILQVTSLISLLRNEIKPLIEEARTTISTVRGIRIFHRMVRNISLEPTPRMARHNSAGGMYTEPIARLRMSMTPNASRERM